MQETETETKCSRCGQVVGVFPKNKYCPYGSDPDGKNNHKYEKVKKQAAAVQAERKEGE